LLVAFTPFALRWETTSLRMQGAEAQMLSNSRHGPLGFGGGGGTHLCPRLFPRLIEGLFAAPAVIQPGPKVFLRTGVAPGSYAKGSPSLA
jgi:hypothetical protein